VPTRCPRQTSPAAVVSPILFLLPSRTSRSSNCALLADALELLPRSWASAAIVPLPIEIVYDIGPAKRLQAQYLPQIQQHAATLDAGQVAALMRV